MIDNRQALEKGYVLHGASYGYEIQKVLGQGTFGITYLAKVKMEGALGTLDSNVMVAVKEFFMREINGREGSTVTSGSNKGIFYDYRKKFKKEAENLSKLNHPNIVKVMESFEANNTIYYVMEYFPGGSLDQRIDNKGLPFYEVIKYTKQIGGAIQFMHQNKMLHLDLKPGNVVLDKDNNAILIDFGLSKQYDENGQPESSTTVGGGTPGYAPLEQANYHDGKGFPTTMDVYALGATIYKMLVGERAPEASEVLNEGFPRQILAAKCGSKEMVACVEKAMAPIKKERYQTVDELMSTLPSCSEETLDELVDDETLPISKDFFEQEHKKWLCEFLTLVKNNKIEYNFVSRTNSGTVAIEQCQKGYRGCVPEVNGNKISSFKIFESTNIENLRNQIEKFIGRPLRSIVAIIQNNATFYQYAKLINELSRSEISVKRVMLRTDAQAFALHHRDCCRILASLDPEGLSLGSYLIQDDVVETLVTRGYCSEANLLDAISEFRSINSINNRDYYKGFNIEIIPSGVLGNQPWFIGLLKQSFGKEPQEENEENLSLRGGALQNLLLTDCLRIERENDLLLLRALSWTISVGTSGGIVTTLIDRDTIIPTKKIMTLTTSKDNQTEMLLVFSTKASPGLYLKDNMDAISCVIFLENLPSRKTGELKIDCCIGIDANLLIFAEISDHETNEQLARQQFFPYPPSLFQDIDLNFLSCSNLLPLPVLDE